MYSDDPKLDIHLVQCHIHDCVLNSCLWFFFLWQHAKDGHERRYHDASAPSVPKGLVHYVQCECVCVCVTTPFFPHPTYYSIRYHAISQSWVWCWMTISLQILRDLIFCIILHVDLVKHVPCLCCSIPNKVPVNNYCSNWCSFSPSLHTVLYAHSVTSVCIQIDTMLSWSSLQWLLLVILSCPLIVT